MSVRKRLWPLPFICSTIVLATTLLLTVTTTAGPLYSNIYRQIVEQAKARAMGRFAVSAEVDRLKAQLPKTLSDKVLTDVFLSDSSNTVTLRYWLATTPEEAEYMLDQKRFNDLVNEEKCYWLGQDNLVDIIRDNSFRIEIVYSIYGTNREANANVSLDDCGDTK